MDWTQWHHHTATTKNCYLRIQSRAWVKTCGAMPCSCCRMRHCSRVTDMAVRSLALLQLVKRTPFSRRQTCEAHSVRTKQLKDGGEFSLVNASASRRRRFRLYIVIDH